MDPFRHKYIFAGADKVLTTPELENLLPGLDKEIAAAQSKLDAVTDKMRVP